MPNLRIAFDDNLGLPAGFSDGLASVVRDSGAFDGCKAVSYHDVGAMIEAFDGGEVAMMFAPAGTLPYLVGPSEVVVEASFGQQRGSALRSILLMRSSDAQASLAEIVRRKMGCVNRYCTTSYWAPMIVLDDRPAAQRPQTLDFHEAAGFDDMLFAVLDGRTDTAVVWDAVLARHPDAVPRTRAVAEYADLPTPLLLANGLLTAPAHDSVVTFATGYKSSDPRDFFNGFIAPNTALIGRFRDGMAQAKHTFGL